MVKMRVKVFLFWFLLALQFCYCNSNGGCYQWNPNGRLAYQTIQYNDPTSMTINSCQQYCLANAVNFAAVEAGQYCFCGNIAPDAAPVGQIYCNQPCNGNPADLQCGSFNENIWVIDMTSQVASPINSVTITASPQSTTITTQITFAVIVDSLSSYQYSFDYGDGSPQTDFYPSTTANTTANTTAYTTKTYYSPGSYLVTAYVRNAASELKAATVLIAVTIPISETTSLNCTPKVNVSEMVDCSFTMGLGSNVQLNLDFGDGTNLVAMLSDTNYFSAGLSPPPYGDTSMLTASIVPMGTTAFMEMSEFQSAGDIYGFELAYNPPTDFQLSVNCPLLSCNYCFDSNNCGGCPSGITSFISGTTSCSSTNNLYFDSVDETCYDTVTGAPVYQSRYLPNSMNYSQYDNSRSFNLPAINQSNNWAMVNQANRFSVASGCVLSYTPGTGSINYRSIEPTEVGDTWFASPVSGNSSVRHFLKAYAFQPQSFTFQHTYNQDGLYNVTGSLSNGLSTTEINSASVLVDVVLIVQCPPFAIVNWQITCIVISPKASSGGTYYWSFGDGTPPLPFSSSLQANKTFNSLGSYTINVIRQSPTTSLLVSYNISIDVIECSCCPPILTPLQMSLDYSTPIRFRKFQTVEQSVLVQLICNDTLSNNKIWSLEMLDQNSPPNVIQSIPILQNLQNNSFITFASYSLPFGLFRITIKVTMNSVQLLDKIYQITSELAGYFEIIPSPLVPIIYQNQSQITITQGSSVVLNPGFETFNPNSLSGSAPQFSSFLWKCRLSNSTQAVSLDPDIDTWLSNCHSATADIRQLSDLGWGYLKVDSTNLAVGFQYILMLTVNSKVVVYSTEVILTGTSTLLVNVISQQTTPMIIECKKPSICFPSPSSLTVNPTSTLLLVAICPTCPTDAPPSSYEWTLTDTLGNPINYAGYNEGDGTMLSLNPKFFTDFIQNRILVSLVYTYNNQINYGYVSLDINQPPANGDCTINSTIGKAGLDLFHINCQGWTSSNGIAHYILYRSDFVSSRIDILSVPIINHIITLPIGLSEYGFQYQLWIEIVDNLGATKQFPLSTVTITQYVAPYKDILDQLDLLKNQGDLASTLAYVTAVATSANYELTLNTTSTSFWSSPTDCLTIPIDASCDNRTFASWIRSNLLDAIESYNPLIMADVCSMANAVNAVILPNELNINGSKSINNILNSMNSAFQALASSSSPELVLRTATSLFAMTSSFIAAVDYSLINLPNVGDQIYLQKYEYDNYDVSLPEDPKDIVYFEEMTVPQWQVDAARRAQIKIASVAAKNILKSVDEITSGLLNDSVVGNSPTIIKVPFGEVVLQYDRVANLTKDISLIDGVQVNFPDFCQFSQISGCSDYMPIQRKIVYYSNNLYKYADSSNLTTTGSLDIDFFIPDSTSKIPISNTSVPFVMKFPQTVFVTTLDLQPSLTTYHILEIHRINMTKFNSTLEIDFTVTNPAVEFALYLRFADNVLDKYVGPMSGEYDYMTTISYNQYHLSWILPSDSVLHQQGIFYLGVGQLSTGDPTAVQLGNNSFLQNFTTDYTVGISAPSCHYFHSTDKQWETNGCSVSTETTTSLTVCNCYHLTIFSAGLFVPPNAIDFDYVFAHADFSENISIYMTIIVILVLYVIFVLWAKNKDEQDLEKIGCVPMPDNDINDHYIYEVVVITGMRKAAATDSKVQIDNN